MSGYVQLAGEFAMQSQAGQTQVGIIMGSRSEWSTMQHIAKMLAKLGVTYEARIVTTSRNTNQLHDYAINAIERGLEVIIAGSGNSALIPRILASKTDIPVLGVPVQKNKAMKKCIDTATKLENQDADKEHLASQATLQDDTSVTDHDGAANAAFLAASMLSKKHQRINEALVNYRRNQQANGLTEHKIQELSCQVA